jgi:hypothetical protein
VIGDPLRPASVISVKHGPKPFGVELVSGERTRPRVPVSAASPKPLRSEEPPPRFHQNLKIVLTRFRQIR